MTETFTLECEVHFDRRGRGSCKVLETGPGPFRPAEPGRVPRVARLMALAIRFDGLLREGAVESYTELARLGHVTRARVTQIMNLLHLAPDIQEEILFLPRTRTGRDALILVQLQAIAQVLDWQKQRRMWRVLAAQAAQDAQAEEPAEK
jgi:hypothetical protein